MVDASDFVVDRRALSSMLALVFWNRSLQLTRYGIESYKMNVIVMSELM